MLDFASALYLGFRHESIVLRPWAQFTTGLPAALDSHPLDRKVSHEMAALQGCERTTLAPSTLHLLWDFFGVFGGSRSCIFLDAGTYPIARWGVERTAARGGAVRVFDHHDPGSLRSALTVSFPLRSRPLVVTDGFCPSCGLPAPVAEYLDAAREFGGWLLIDDTQALGIFGHSQSPWAPYGCGGGGMLRSVGLTGDDVVLACSMAKGFGVPLAVLSGSAEVIDRFEARSETRMHCSPPSVVALHAAANALQLNRERGDAVRQRLARLVRHFRSRLQEAGFTTTGGLFPVQTLTGVPARKVAGIHGGLLKNGVRTVLHRSRHDSTPRIGFLITARHTEGQLDNAVERLRLLTNRPGYRTGLDPPGIRRLNRRGLEPGRTDGHR